MDDQPPSADQPDDATEPDADVGIDDVDRGIMFALQRDARNITIQEIADEVSVSASTVRNRIDKLEHGGVIEGYAPQINYERAGFPLKLLFICSVDSNSRAAVAEEVLAVDGVIDVNELVTGERNLHVQAVATSTGDLTRMTADLNEYGLMIHSSEIITNHYSQPWGYFEYELEED
ncbi:Lrp/AsnC family transcriptional regulator [Haloferax namakaokahaiae]|uniref:Lrp/AsnC family transcriptional regulator n=1 Tax=Haloferax namakaokahaiae TaxID=1748331 RepID=A0ABD5ZFP4_9EURY